MLPSSRTAMRTHLAIIGVIILTGLIGRPLAAQSLGNEDLHIQQVETEVMEGSPAQEVAMNTIMERLRAGERAILDAHTIRGSGVGGNFAAVGQEGDDNTASVTQIGLSNIAVMYQQGTGNSAAIEQRGDGNIFGAWVIGAGNQLNVLQQGTDNVYMLDFVGDNLDHAVQQIGNGIEAVQTGSARRPFSIEQRGSGMSIRIDHNTP